MLKKLPHTFLKPFPYWEKIDFFRKVLYVFLLLNTLSLLPILDEVFGYEGIVGTSGWNTAVPWYAQGSKGLLNLLSHPLNYSYPWVAMAFVVGQVLFLITGLLNFLPRLSAIAIYFFTANLFVKGYLMFTGGEVLISILLFYLMFIQQSKNEEGDFTTAKFSPLQNVINNTFYWVILIQICVVYVLSNVYKLIDPIWLSGEAMQFIAQVDAFSSGLMRSLFVDHPLMSKMATYTVLIYQGLFPIVVWIKKLKIPFLCIGVLLHLGIALGMGVFTFGVVMIITYLLFLDTKSIQRIKRQLLKRRKRKELVKIENV